MQNIFTIRNIIIYLIVINLVGFLAMLLDKRKAQKHKWRIPEKTLFYITFLGGGIGTTIGMYLFRHKTQKSRFVILFPTITIVEILLITYLFIKYGSYLKLA